MFTLLNKIAFRVLSLLRRRRVEDEFDSEIQAHVELLVEENIRRGMSPVEARRAALLRFGGVSQIRENHRKSRGIAHLEALLQDLRYAFRQMRGNIAFTAIAILSLALGTGANLALFQLFDTILLRTLPVVKPQELQIVGVTDTRKNGNFRGRWPILTYAQWEQLRSSQLVFSDIAAWGNSTMNISQGGETRYAQTLFVSGNFFQTLGVEPMLGRLLTPDDDKTGCGASGAVISYSFWQREFGGETSVIGKKLALGGHLFDIIGITPATFFGMEVGQNFDAAVPICTEGVINAGAENKLIRRHAWWLAAVGRLKPGIRAEQAAAQISAVSPAIFKETLPQNYPPDSAKNYLTFKLTTLPGGNGISKLRDGYLQPLAVLMALSGLVLLIACANLANLLLARASAREREIATRMALGASRGRLIRQLLSESMLLAIIGTALGLMVSKWLSRFLVSLLSTRNNQVFVNLSLDWTVLGFIVGLSVVTCVLFGLAPALKATGNAANTISSAGRGTTASREKQGLRRALVISQVALSLVLLIGALLFIRTMHNISTLDLGFERKGIMIASIDFGRITVDSTQRLRDLLLDRLRRVPGVDSAADTGAIPVSGTTWWNTLVIVDGNKGLSNVNRVSSDYFRTMGISVLAGRDFDNRDRPTAPPVVLVNEAFSRRFFNGANPVGKTFHREVGLGDSDPALEIIGLVKDTKYSDMREELMPNLYYAEEQQANPGTVSTVLIRSSLPASVILPSVKEAIIGINPTITVDFRTLESQIDDSMSLERLMAKLSAFFGILALMLASLGLYGVMSYTVTQRKKEIGIRMALGATRAAIMEMILREAALLLIIGLAIGIVTTLFVAKAAGSMLFGLQANDIATYAMGAAALALIGLFACLAPAQRASRLDPIVALRIE